MKRFIFKVCKHNPVFIEGHVHIDAKSKRKARKKLWMWGGYHIEEIKQIDL